MAFGHDIAPFLLIDAQVIWKRLYSSCSGIDTGTLFQLRNLINRRNVNTDVSKDLTACEEFMQLATIAHVMSAAIQITGVTSKIMSTDKPMAAVKSLVKTLTSEMVRIEYIAGTSESTCPSIDSVQEYAKETLSLGLLLLEFKDGIREGDGNRVLRCWKYFLLFFRATTVSIKITAQKHSTYRCSITISCPNGMLKRCCGAASSTVRVDLDTTYQRISFGATRRHFKMAFLWVTIDI